MITVHINGVPRAFDRQHGLTLSYHEICGLVGVRFGPPLVQIYRDNFVRPLSPNAWTRVDQGTRIMVSAPPRTYRGDA